MNTIRLILAAPFVVLFLLVAVIGLGLYAAAAIIGGTSISEKLHDLAHSWLEGEQEPDWRA